MEDGRTKYTDADAYISSFPTEIRSRLEELRDTIRTAAPGAQEKISYNMPAFFLNGVLVYYAAYKGHIGFYPTADGITAFTDELMAYKSSKGAVQFPHSQPLPWELIGRIVKHRVDENLKKTK